MVCVLPMGCGHTHCDPSLCAMSAGASAGRTPFDGRTQPLAPFPSPTILSLIPTLALLPLLSRADGPVFDALPSDGPVFDVPSRPELWT
jgi:hypothetical protein